MAPPTLEQLLNFFRDHDLPKDVAAEYKDATIEEMRVCDQNDTLFQRMYGYPNNPNNVIFFPAETPVSGFLDIDSTLNRGWNSATGGGVFLQKSRDSKGGESDFLAQLDRCRGAEPSSGKGADARYPVYATSRVVRVRTDRDILDNHPDVPGLRDVGFDFLPGEIVAIVNGVKMDRVHYAVHTDNPARLMVFPELTLVERIIAFIESDGSPIAAERRKGMVAAFNEAFRHELEAVDTQRAQKKSIEDAPGNMMWTTVISVVGGSLLGGAVMWLFNRKLIDMQKRSLGLMEEQIEENRRLMSGEQKLPSPEERARIFETVSRDITKQAAEGGLDPVLGRDAEIAQIIEILNANRLTGAQVPALIGERGVGKSAIFEGIAQEVAAGRLPQYKRVVEIDIPALVAGTGVRGSLETKLGVVKWMIENNPDTLFVMDEVHMIIGAGKTEGSSIDAAQILKSTLARRGSNLIVGTTLAEYKQHIMVDEAFESRMTAVPIEPVKGEVRAKIFKGVRDFVLNLSREMDEKAGETPRDFVIPDKVIEHLGNIVGGNNREIKKTLGRLVARARSDNAPGSKITLTTKDVDRIVEEVNVARRALGQPLLGEAVVMTPDAAAAGSPEKFVEIILLRHPELKDPKFEKSVVVAARAAAKLSANAEEGEPVDPVSYAEEAVRRVAAKMAELKLPEADDFRAVLDRRAGAESALQEAAPTPAGGAWNEVFDYRINDRAIYDALARIDRNLAEFYRAQISPVGSPVSTMSDLIARVSVLDPRILDESLGAATTGNRPLTQVAEHAVFELIQRTAEARGVARVADPTVRPRLVAQFEADLRNNRGVEARQAERRAEGSERPEDEKERREGRVSEPAPKGKP